MTVTINGTTGITSPGGDVASTSVTTPIIGAASGSALSLQSNGTTNATLDTSGNFGLGVTPSAWYSGYKAFQVNAVGSVASYTSGTINVANNWYSNSSGTDTYLTSNYASIYQQASGQHRWFIAPSGTAGGAISFTQAMTLDSSGRLLLGATSSLASDGTVQVNGGKLIINSTDSSFGLFQLGNSGSSSEASIQFISGVTAFGTAPTSTNGDYYLWNIGAGNYGIGGNYFSVANKGYGGPLVKLAYNSTSWISVSDERIKNIQSNVSNANDIIKDWRVVYYTFKNDSSNTLKIGLIAQDVQKTLPQVLDVPESDLNEKGGINPLGVHYSEIVPVLVKAIQELSAQVTTLQAQVTALQPKGT